MNTPFRSTVPDCLHPTRLSRHPSPYGNLRRAVLLTLACMFWGDATFAARTADGNTNRSEKPASKKNQSSSSSDIGIADGNTNRSEKFASKKNRSSSSSDIGMGVQIGLTGVGLTAGIELFPSLAMRGIYAGGTLTLPRQTKENISYDTTVRLQSFGILFDWKPLPLIPRLTAGVLYNGNKLDLAARSSGTYTFGEAIYNTSDIGLINVQFVPPHKLAPYLGIGWGQIVSPGIGIYTDVGVILSGQYTYDFQATCSASATNCAAIQRSVQAESDKLNQNPPQFTYWPVLNIGLTVGF